MSAADASRRHWSFVHLKTDLCRQTNTGTWYCTWAWPGTVLEYCIVSIPGKKTQHGWHGMAWQCDFLGGPGVNGGRKSGKPGKIHSILIQ